LCAEYVDHGNWWFPERGESVTQARAIYSRCLVQADCLGWALDYGSQLPGLWGGTSDRERKRLREGGITGELVRRYGVHAIAGRTLERDHALMEAIYDVPIR
jgi:hypothetical protein